jgi:hypothetical protein
VSGRGGPEQLLRAGRGQFVDDLLLLHECSSFRYIATIAAAVGHGLTYPFSSYRPSRRKVESTKLDTSRFDLRDADIDPLARLRNARSLPDLDR